MKRENLVKINEVIKKLLMVSGSAGSSEFMAVKSRDLQVLA